MLAGFSEAEVDEMERQHKSLYLAATSEMEKKKKKRKWMRPFTAKQSEGTWEPLGFQAVLFYIELDIGTPSQKFRLHLDTGSSTLAVPSSSCNSCKAHCNPAYSLDSSSIDKVDCSSKKCCGLPFCSSSVCAAKPESDKCGFEVRYVDGSSISGLWVQDQVKIANFSDIPLYFGAVLEMSETFEPPEIDGIVGVSMTKLNTNMGGQSFDTIIDALSAQHNVPKIFSMCFGLRGGTMVFGAVDHDHMMAEPQYTPFDSKSGYYLSQVDSIRVGTRTFSTPHYVVVDSGTTLWYVPKSVRADMIDTLSQRCGRLCQAVDALVQGYCVSFKNESIVNELPNITVTFAEGASMDVPATSYMRLGLCGHAGYRAFGVQAMDSDCGSRDSPCLYGDVFMMAHTWVFDQENSRVGFAPQRNCDKETFDTSACPLNSTHFEGGNVTDSGASLLLSPFASLFALGTATHPTLSSTALNLVLVLLCPVLTALACWVG
jgi:cathepsin D